MNVEHVLQALRETLGLPDLEGRQLPINETVVALPPECVQAAAQTLVDRLEVTHLSTITGQDKTTEIELLYHFWDGHGLTLRTSLPQECARIATLIDLIPGAAYYEREIAEMLHVTFEGHPDPPALLLPDDWNGDPPLRRASAPESDEEHPQ